MGWLSGIFPEVHCLPATPECWSTPCFVESEISKQSILATFRWTKTNRFTDFRKNDFSRKAMLAKHSRNHSCEQSKLKRVSTLQTCRGLVLDIFWTLVKSKIHKVLCPLNV